MDWREDLDFEIGWTRNNLRILGIWPDSGRPGKDSLFYRYKFLIPSMLMLIYIILPQTLYLFFAWGDLEHCVDALLTADVPILTALIKFLSFSYHREAINSIVSFVTEDWKRPKSREERETMMRNAKIARGISLRISILLYLAMAAHVASHIATEVRRRLSNDTNLEPQVLLRGYYPFDTKKSPNYELLSFMQLISGIGGALSYSNVDSFVGATILHVCAQFSNLRFLAAKMLRKAEKQEPLEFRKTLRIIVERHTSLTWVTLVIEECFNKMFLAQTVSTGEKETLVLRSIFFIVFTGAMLVHFFVYCYVGEMLYGQSAGLCDTLYESNWYEMPPENIRDLMVIMVATKKPIYITAGKFFPFLFDTFTNVLKSSMGYLSVLVAMRDRLVEA
ncbi:odorant receptor 2a [Orussus abietinus]|uniref:odorant receptor 2a n=1 Tax=Orussus abietinus TaxID=222816 RepID=UPI0006268269|nr:odorant receptor 2a [Orussus abietinus]